jgi:hypothetical protein
MLRCEACGEEIVDERPLWYNGLPYHQIHDPSHPDAEKVRPKEVILQSRAD